jgi:SAM-dependent methyltransferase
MREFRSTGANEPTPWMPAVRRPRLPRFTEMYDTLADVYEYLTPDQLLTPHGNVDAFAPWIEPLPANAPVLDCACGIGLLAVGLALAGYRAEASDISPAMIARTRSLAEEHGVELPARVCAWADLEPGARYDLVFCVGNSLAHAQDRRAALAAIARTLNPGGMLLITSRNWERERALGSRTEDEGNIHRVWTIPETWDEPHHLDVSVQGVTERLTFWPFTHETLQADLRASDLDPHESTYEPEADRYLVSAKLKGLAL